MCASIFLAVLSLHLVSHLCLSVTSFGLPLIPDALPKETSVEPCSTTPSVGLKPVLGLMLIR